LNWASFLNAAPAAEGMGTRKSAAKKPPAKKTAKGKTKEVAAVE
jgi:hypothetical protein